MKKIIGALVIILIVIGGFLYFNSNKDKENKIGREGLLIEGKGLTEFSRENNPTNQIPDDAVKLAKDIAPLLTDMGGGNNLQQNKETIKKLGTIIKKYPDYDSAYVIRATLTLINKSTNYDKILMDVDTAIKLNQSKKYGESTFTLPALYSLRAKVDILANNQKQALDDLTKAITVSPDNVGDIFNSGGVKPEEQKNPSALQKEDFDLLVSQLPNDYRAYILRGLFYNSFSFLDTQYYKPAADDLKKAISLNPDSELPYYFLATVYQKAAMFIYSFKIDGTTADYDTARDNLNTKALENFTQAIKINPTFKEGLAAMAGTLYSLKRYTEAIPYYDKVIAIDPKDTGALNDRGLSKTYTKNYLGASLDFSDSIRYKKEKNAGAITLQDTYEHRGDANVELGDYNNAIDDYSNAIGQKLSWGIFIMSLPQIRQIYPEFNDILDKDFLEGLRQKYYPNMSSDDFVGQFAKNKNSDDFILSGLFVKRGDAYLKKGDFRKALAEYKRANFADKNVMNNRWKTFSLNADNEYQIDTQSLSFGTNNLPSLWVKIINNNDGSYYQTNFELNCQDRKIKSLISTNYNGRGGVITTIPEMEWQSVAPDTIGEALYNGVCRGQ